MPKVSAVLVPAALAAALFTTGVLAQQPPARPPPNPPERRVPGVPGSGPGAAPTAERSVPAESKIALAKDPKWKAPRTSWGAPSLDGQWSVDDMRGIPAARPEAFGTRDSLTQEEFMQRARQQQGGDDRARKEETFLRNEWGTRVFAFASLVVDPPNGRMPELTPAGKAKAAAAKPQGTFSNQVV